MATRVLIVDTHEMVRNSLALFLELYEEFELVGQADDGPTGWALCSELLPDVVITEINLPRLDGITLTQKITQSYAQVRVIALDIIQQREAIEAILQAGASRYLFKEVSIDQLAEAIREVANERTFRPITPIHNKIYDAASVASDQQSG